MGDNGAGQGGDWLRDGLLARNALGETWEGLAEVCWELSTTEWALPTECPGWDVKDQLSHLIGIELAIMGEPVPEWNGTLGDHVKNDFAATNEPFVAVRRASAGAAVRAEFVEVPYAEFMRVRVFDSWVHEQDVRRALDRPGGSGNAASEISLGHVQRAMPFVVGKKAGCSDGTAVRFVVTGPGHDERAFTIAVEGGRARAVGDEVAPTVILSLSGIDFVRLGCGRATSEPLVAAGAVALEGDTTTGRSVLAAMNFMF
jgi:uncharacterized protein (TIGR03083 family)